MSRALPYGRHYVDDDDIQAVVEVLRHGWLTQGPKIAEFEQAIADYVGAKYAVAVSNGTAALHLACIAADIGKGDVVVTSPNTFVASASSALCVGATPQFSDIDAETLNMDTAALAARCTELGRVRAIVPVHFGGLPCDMPEIRKIADAAQAVVIEDAAHALGATYADGSRVGCCAYSEMTVFSFHPVKIMTTGEGGIITTNEEKLYRGLLRLRSHGITKGNDPYLHRDLAYTDGEPNMWYYEMQEVGLNYRITDIQCALGISQLRKLPRFLERRRELALQYDRMFVEVRHIRPGQPTGRERSAHHLYVVRIDFDAIGRSRNAFMRALKESSILSQVHYIPVHTHPFFRRNGHERDRFPVMEDYYGQALSLPLFYGLSDQEQRYVVGRIKELLGCG
ncbi:MAG: UDP-4-amino-4,6-dideoxy-N-acetyl-beta-L-altrosamine transaminase [Betaproteobacteria bacterium]|nr:UDP-4-amino-4,6-dideoxy-N-acetyl-beta-L-altrosamine transaminase [Betaproteobacteria bacterium]